MDQDVDAMSRDDLIAEVRKLRRAIRAHRDKSGHDLCWYHPRMWSLLPEKVDPEIAVPHWDKFMRGCVAFRKSLEVEAPNAPVHDKEFEG
jgi:hypothetical protein